ncbi:nucleoside-diphosphate kinase [Candidatus Saganbacteria bacterium]|uniref:Nucleoside diphosphate kinase n=1 Tax=Candidatus Saganbacteria bacterium TaxID=2575572 RepID=A0A9D6UMJ6_UNCSA|nr:nucleoside-diphosphate kinase [Candidatus Saganbacteria bacterium]
MPEKTFFLIKPDGVARRLEEEIFDRVEKGGLKIVLRKKTVLTLEQAGNLYKPHFGKEFYPGLIEFITSGPVIACVVEGEQAVYYLRNLMGDTDPLKAKPGTIRGDLREDEVINNHGSIKNLVHGSDSPDSAEREIAIFFKEINL